MVFVKVRETYDMKTVKNKMSVIAIHTPDPKIIKNNFPGLLMQCKTYRPYSCDVRVACASMLPVDPLGVGTTEGAVAPEDMFNPILYSAMSNLGMSQLEARICALGSDPLTSAQVEGNSAAVDTAYLTAHTDEFPIYYGLLSNAHGWKHANPQSGLQMNGLKPLVYEVLANVGDSSNDNSAGFGQYSFPGNTTTAGEKVSVSPRIIRGNGKPMPMINCTSYSTDGARNPFITSGTTTEIGVDNHELDVPWIKCVVGAIIVPPSKLHELFYRMVVEWTIEFSSIRPIGEICSINSLAFLGTLTHYQNYSYASAKEALTGDSSTILSSDASMVSANVDISKVM